ncbi:MAG: hypothetical protein M0Z49_10185 [Chloroflexi bacterium]|nr:hypothetical protein [Chloroflexota bacterium]
MDGVTATRREVPVSGQSELALGSLRVLAHGSRAWDATRLGTALGTRADLLAEVLGRLVAMGWVRATMRSGRVSYRYAQPRPEPTLAELIAAIDGAMAADDCILGLGTCAGLRGSPVCSGHDGWLRQLGSSALLATPVLPALAQRGPPAGDRGSPWRNWLRDREPPESEGPRPGGPPGGPTGPRTTLPNPESADPADALAARGEATAEHAP